MSIFMESMKDLFPNSAYNDTLYDWSRRPIPVTETKPVVMKTKLPSLTFASSIADEELIVLL